MTVLGRNAVFGSAAKDAPRSKIDGEDADRVERQAASVGRRAVVLACVGALMASAILVLMQNGAVAATTEVRDRTALRVCADPANVPTTRSASFCKTASKPKTLPEGCCRDLTP